MTENTDPSDSDCTDSDCVDFESLMSSTVLDDFERPVTVKRPPCEACETQRHDGLNEVPLGDDVYAVCDECIDHLIDEIERYYWWDRLTEAHYDRAAEFLRSLDSVWCVKDHAYQGGEMWVHTPYCNATPVSDVCDHFGFSIYSFQIVEPGEHEFDCVHDHGPCVEINLDYNNRVKGPAPLEYDIIDNRTYYDVEYLEDEDPMFDRED